MTKRRVLVFSTVFPSPADPNHGLFVWQRIRHLAAAAELRIVAPVSFRRSRKRQRVRQEDGISVHHPRFVYVPRLCKWLDGFWLFLSSVMTVARLRRSFRFELIDTHFAFPEGFAAVLLGACFRCPVVITERGTLITLSRFPARRALANWALRRATKVITVAEPLARRVAEAGVAPEEIEIIGNGVDIERFRPRDARATRTRLGIPTEGRLLVSVGHLSKRKGFDRVLRAVREVRERHHPDIRLAIVGGGGVEGNEYEALVSLARELGLGDCARFTGALPAEGVAEWLAASDLFVFASDYEGCPNVLWEALASGRPVVTSNVGDAARIVPPQGGLVYDDAHDLRQLTGAIVAALKRPWDTAAIRAYATQHTWHGVAKRVADVWSDAVESSGARPHSPPTNERVSARN